MSTRPAEGQHVRHLSARRRVYETLAESAFKEFRDRTSTGASGATGSTGSQNYRLVATCFLNRARLPESRRNTDTRSSVTRPQSVEVAERRTSDRSGHEMDRRSVSARGTRYAITTATSGRKLDATMKSKSRRRNDEALPLAEEKGSWRSR